MGCTGRWMQSLKFSVQSKELSESHESRDVNHVNEIGEAENEVKRQFGELDSIQATLASKRQKLNMAAMDTSGTHQETRSPGENTNSLFVVSWNVAGIAEEDTNSFFDRVNDAHTWDILLPPLRWARIPDSDGHLMLHDIGVAWRSPLHRDCGKQSVVQAEQCC